MSPPSAVEILDEPVLDVTAQEALSPKSQAPAPSAVAKGSWFYGWAMLPLAMLVMVATSPGQTFGITFFNADFRDVFRLSQTALSATYLVATVTAALAQPMIGSWVDHYGLRRATITAVAAMAAACVFASQAQGIFTLFLALLLLRTIGAGTMVLLANNTLAAWFDRRLGMTIGIMQLAMAAAIGFVPAGIVAMIGVFGWRGAYVALGAILAGGLLPLLVVFYRQSPDEVGQFADGAKRACLASARRATEGMNVRQATQHRSYWILLAAVGVWAMVGTSVLFHLAAIFRSCGFDEAYSVRAVTYMAIAMASMQIVGGVLADRLAARWLVATAIGLISTSCAMLATGFPNWLTASYVVYGLGQGLMTIAAGTVWPRYFGRAHLGKVRGTSLTAAMGAASVGPLMMGISSDYLGGFGPSLWLLASLSLLVAIACLWATPPKTSEI